MTAHWHITTGLTGGFLPETATVSTDVEDAATVVHEALSRAAECATQDADALGDQGDEAAEAGDVAERDAAHGAAWRMLRHADALSVLAQTYAPSRREAPAYAQDRAAWRATLDRALILGPWPQTHGPGLSGAGPTYGIWVSYCTDPTCPAMCPGCRQVPLLDNDYTDTTGGVTYCSAECAGLGPHIDDVHEAGYGPPGCTPCEGMCHCGPGRSPCAYCADSGDVS